MKIFNYIWCAPQLIAGLIVKIFTGAKKDERGLYIWNSGYGLSLDKYVFVNKDADENTIKHEQGHTKQSRMLGPLYLFVIGIPSMVWCHLFEGYRKKYNISYYDFYCEKWADELGGVKRK